MNTYTLRMLFPGMFLLIQYLASAQSAFNIEDYQKFRQQIEGITSEEIYQKNLPQDSYCNEIIGAPPLSVYRFYDSIKNGYSLTSDEINLLDQNHFMVTERLNYSSFADAFLDVYKRDLPIYFSTDALLHAVHMSYDKILIDVERNVLIPNLKSLIAGMRSEVLSLKSKYDADTILFQSLKDADLFLTVGESLLTGETVTPDFSDNQEKFEELLTAIESKSFVQLPLFTEASRSLDFSQFIVRGHYEGDKELEPYFLAMMWFGRTDFWLTKPPSNSALNFTDADIQRMMSGAFIINELLTTSGTEYLQKQNEDIITAMVGISDNLTPSEWGEYLTQKSIDDAGYFLVDSSFEEVKADLKSNDAYQQMILSDVFWFNPADTTPDLPISYKLLGQRFIPDSYILSSIVYPNSNLFMPNPLDVLYGLGNSDAGMLLKDTLAKYEYGEDLETARYLIETFNESYWESSLYNTWLNAIRKLNPPADTSGLPFYMNTVAWHHEKLNTQLASWAELRHDNLLYSKQSYTGGAVCYYPYGYVEPYPEFYETIGAFANNAKSYFLDLMGEGNVTRYFGRLGAISDTLRSISEKELNHQPLNKDEIRFMQRLLYEQMVGCTISYDGWYSDLFYHSDEVDKPDMIVADVHTMPTDEAGVMVGHVLHVGTGKVNLGVFLLPSPCMDSTAVAFVGPVMSYYEKITKDFDRLTDSRWSDMVFNNKVPARPDWTNVYLADENGEAKTVALEMPGTSYQYNQRFKEVVLNQNPKDFTIELYPNPTSDKINVVLPKMTGEYARFEVYNNQGRILYEKNINRDDKQLELRTSTLKNGIYFIVIRDNTNIYSRKFIVR